ncbi:heavy metal-associated domain-containing protein [Bradyrhizobium sp. ISRA430]|uniref:heavy-metal-associated domain-containing protein n=1 Tax=Bradyrhizobium sp. ISRA430 TaxID=2866192 RepID=UPI0032AF5053
MQAAIDFYHYLRGQAGPRPTRPRGGGINCTGCMGKIERKLSSISDVTSARVNLR